MIFLQKNNKGQHITEYVLLMILVMAGIFVMGPYMKRSWNGQMRGWEVSVKDTMQDPLKEASPFSTIPCHCEYSPGVCTFIVPNERKLEKNLICDPIGCHGTLGYTDADLHIYEYATATTSGTCCIQSITPNTCWILADLPANGGNGHIPGGCQPGHIEIKKTCDQSSITYHCSVNQESDYIDQGNAIGSSLCNNDGTHDSCLNTCLNSDGDSITDPNDPNYNNVRYDGFCPNDLTGLTSNTYITYVNSSGCSGVKCEVKCKPPFVARDGNCWCPEPWEIQYNQAGNITGCSCPNGLGAYSQMPNMIFPELNNKCQYANRASILIDKNISIHVGNGDYTSPPVNLAQLTTACTNLGEGYTLVGPHWDVAQDGGLFPWVANPSSSENKTEYRTSCYHVSSAGGCWLRQTKNQCETSLYGQTCEWHESPHCLCISKEGPLDRWDPQLTPDSLLTEYIDNQNELGVLYAINQYTYPLSYPRGRSLNGFPVEGNQIFVAYHRSTDPNIAGTGGFNSRTLFRREAFAGGFQTFPDCAAAFQDDTAVDYNRLNALCPPEVTTYSQCLAYCPGYWLPMSSNYNYGDNPPPVLDYTNNHYSYPVGAACPEGYAMKGIRAFNSTTVYYSGTQNAYLLDVCGNNWNFPRGDNYWSIICQKVEDKPDGLGNCLINNSFSLEGPFYENSSSWVGADCPSEPNNTSVMIALITQTTNQDMPDYLFPNQGFTLSGLVQNLGGKNMWWILCQKVDPQCLVYATGDTSRRNGNYDYFFYTAQHYPTQTPVQDTLEAPMCSFMRGIWTNNFGHQGRNSWYIKYIR